MPYKDPERKKQWELRHRPSRLARRRELRRVYGLRGDTQPELPTPKESAASPLLLPLIAGAAFASYDPALGIAAGSLTLLVAAVYKKGWSWWATGTIILAVGLLFQRYDQSANK